MGTGNSRLFAIARISDPNFPSGPGSLTLRNVYIKDFRAKGGDGGIMRGGDGLGAGGAIYVLEGSLTVENHGDSYQVAQRTTWVSPECPLFLPIYLRTNGV